MKTLQKTLDILLLDIIIHHRNKLDFGARHVAKHAIVFGGAEQPQIPCGRAGLKTNTKPKKRERQRERDIERLGDWYKSLVLLPIGLVSFSWIASSAVCATKWKSNLSSFCALAFIYGVPSSSSIIQFSDNDKTSIHQT